MTGSYIDATAPPFFGDCPRCGLSVGQRLRGYAMRHCPRCVSRSRAFFELHRSPAASDDLGLLGAVAAPAAAPSPPAQSRPALTLPAPLPELQPASRHDLADRVATGVVTLVPIVALAVAMPLAWGDVLHWFDLLVLALCYVPSGLGITVGFHRLLTHRAFATRPWIRAVLTVLGCMAIEGPPIEWVANHRKHHAYSDEEGDPHSPHVNHAGGLAGSLRGLWHAHLGWVFRGGMANQERYARDLLADPVVRFIDRTFVLWALAGLAIPAGLGWAITGGTTEGALTGLLWGGAVRVMLLHHVTFSINSLCHYFGRQDFETTDHSTNLAWLAPLSFGESWHNNHHAFPRSAVHGLGRWQLDLSALVIRSLARLRLAWDLTVVSPERQASKRLER